MDWDSVRKDAQDGLEKMAYSLPLYAPARSLSGGNLQRMVIIHELQLNYTVSSSPLAHDTWTGRAEHTRSRQALLDVRGARGVLLISEDLEELFTW